MNRFKGRDLWCGVLKVLALGLMAAPIVANAGLFTNPALTVSASPSATVLRMELNGFANYGVVDTAADIAYTGDSNLWTFDLPAGTSADDFIGAFFRASLILDDHADVPVESYSLRVSTNGTEAFNGPAGVPHGAPFGSVFSNWVARDFAVNWPLGSPVTFALTNTSTAAFDDWIAIDWIELHLVARVVPEPAALVLFGLGFAALLFSARLTRLSR